MKHARFANIVVALLMLAALLPLPAQTVNAEPVQPRLGTGRLVNHEAQYVPGEIVVVFKSDVPKTEYASQAQALAGTINAAVKKQRGDTALLKLDESVDVFAASDKLLQNPSIKIAEPNYIYGHDTGPTPPTPNPNNPTPPPQSDEEKEMKAKKKTAKIQMFPNDEFNSWANAGIQHQIIWPEASKSGDVCLIDTGVDYKHPDLKGKIIKGYDYVNDDNDPMDDNGHGTFIAGIIAANVNNKIGPAGISNGKVVAIKALGSEGWGTTYDLGWAIQDCYLPGYAAINSRVKVINLSFGSFAQSDYLYDVISTATSYPYYKLVVAASANASTSEPSYPAAWASPTQSGISSGFISVSSMAAPYNLITWVDKDGDRQMDPNSNASLNEVFDANQCSTSFASYGPWVELIAPGEAIYSSTPVSEPFSDNYYYGVPEGYAYMDGSSFASAVTSAAAVRAWSVYPTWSNADIESKLIYSGGNVTTANDGYNFYGTAGYTNFNPSAGYWQSSSNTSYVPFTWNIQGYTVSYGDIFPYNYGGSYYNTQLAPYCWPTTGGAWTADQDSSDIHILNVAAAMDRYGYKFVIRNANTGLPIPGLTATVKTLDGVLAATAYTESKVSANVYAINLKTNTGYDLFVNKPGYTAGPQRVAHDWGENYGGWIMDYSYLDIGIPPISKNISVVANYYRRETPYESDLLLFLPYNIYARDSNNALVPLRGSVGPNALWHAEEQYLTSTNYKTYYVEGTTTQVPYARYMSYNDTSMETIMIKNYPGASRPIFGNPNGSYSIYVGSYDWDSLMAAYPYIRIWQNGYIMGKIVPGDTLYCSGSQNWWHAASLDVDNYGRWSINYNEDCGDRGIWPY